MVKESARRAGFSHFAPDDLRHSCASALTFSRVALKRARCVFWWVFSGASSQERTEFCSKLRDRLAARYGREVPVNPTPSPGKELVLKGTTFDADTKTDDYAGYLWRHLNAATRGSTVAWISRLIAPNA